MKTERFDIRVREQKCICYRIPGMPKRQFMLIYLNEITKMVQMKSSGNENETERNVPDDDVLLFQPLRRTAHARSQRFYFRHRKHHTQSHGSDVLDRGARQRSTLPLPPRLQPARHARNAGPRAGHPPQQQRPARQENRMSAHETNNTTHLVIPQNQKTKRATALFVLLYRRSTAKCICKTRI